MIHFAFLLQAEAALIYDSVFVFAIGLQTLEQSHTLRLSNVSCDKEQPWDGGLSLINYINAVSTGSLLIRNCYITNILLINPKIECQRLYSNSQVFCQLGFR